MTISCYHHQGLGRLGDGLRASAYAEDGTIEAVALDGHDGWYLGVQWHPEDTAATDAQQAGVFAAFVARGHVVRRLIVVAGCSIDVTIARRLLVIVLLPCWRRCPRTTRDSMALNFG